MMMTGDPGASWASISVAWMPSMIGMLTSLRPMSGTTFLACVLVVVGVGVGDDVRDAGGLLAIRVVLYRPEYVLVVGVDQQPLEFLSLLERDDHGEARSDATRVGATRGPNPDDLQVGKG